MNLIDQIEVAEAAHNMAACVSMALAGMDGPDDEQRKAVKALALEAEERAHQALMLLKAAHRPEAVAA